MKKLIVCLGAFLVLACSYTTVSANAIPAANPEVAVTNQIHSIYSQIDFSGGKQLSFDVFDKAYRGYVNLRNEGKISGEKKIISICDFNLPSTENRLWIIDLDKKKVLFNTYVAHGQGSGDTYAHAFSNNNNSHQSSLGFYVTGDVYTGEHGTSLRLVGMDQGFNDAALDRGIVVHAANYVCNKYVCQNHRLGRSWGCPAVAPQLSMPIINTIKDKTCLFIYYPEAKYLKTGYWLNKKITRAS